MLANVGGSLALVLGLSVLLVPLLAPELSRPRDAAWGGLVLLLGLALVTSSERLTGSPMLIVVCGSLLIGRLATEVGQARWRQLTTEEQIRLGSAERWTTSLSQLGQTTLGLVARSGGVAVGLGGWLGQHRPGVRRSKGKRWVRPALQPGAPLSPPLVETEASDGVAPAMVAPGMVAPGMVVPGMVAVGSDAAELAVIKPVATEQVMPASIQTAAIESAAVQRVAGQEVAGERFAGQRVFSEQVVSEQAVPKQEVSEQAALDHGAVQQAAVDQAAVDQGAAREVGAQWPLIEPVAAESPQAGSAQTVAGAALVDVSPGQGGIGAGGAG